MVPLALTSTTGWIRRLGGRNWQMLHRLVYLTGIAGVTHYWWKVKADTLHPAIYAIIIGGLLGFRLVRVAETIAVAAAADRSARITVHDRIGFDLAPSGRPGRHVRDTLADLRRQDVVRRIWARDPTVWTGEDEDRWLGWLRLPMQDRANLSGTRAFQR